MVALIMIVGLSLLIKLALTIYTDYQQTPSPDKRLAPSAVNADGNVERLRTPALVLELGSFKVYVLQTADEAMHGVAPDGFYWCDPASPQGYGPFGSIYEAVEHYKHVLEQCKGDRHSMVLKAAPVIRVDFQNRRKVEH